MKNNIKNTLLIIVMSLLVEFGFSQSKINIPISLYKKYSEKELGNYILSTNLFTNNCDSIFLNLKNNTDDTVCIVAYFVLEWPKDVPYMIFCLSDSLLRKQSNENGFDLNDVDYYWYSTKYLKMVDPITNLIYYNRLVFCDEEHASQDNYIRIIYPKKNIIIPISYNYYYEDKYMFLRFQTKIRVKNNWYRIQKETNSIFMPKCKKQK